MIIFLGDSFTWGQGLCFERWIVEENKTIEYCNSFIPPLANKHQERLSYEDDLYRKTNHFPALVAKHFNKSYTTQFGNGGANHNIRDIIKNINIQFGSNTRCAIEAFVIQLTDCGRSMNPTGPIVDDIEVEIKKQISEIKEEITFISKSIPWYVFSWRKDMGNILQKDYVNNFIPLVYNDTIYNNFHHILRTDPTFGLDKKYKGMIDSHFSIDGHQFIAKNIINKIQTSNKLKISKNY